MNTRLGLEFFMQCRAFLVGMCQKIVERCPLKNDICRYISAFVPSKMVFKKKGERRGETCIKRFDKLLDELLKAGRVSTTEADRANLQFEALLRDDHAVSQLKKFRESEGRLDALFHSLVGEDSQKQELWKCVQIVLLLSHGNATVESGFSVNKSMMVENLKMRSIIAQRTVYDSVKLAGGCLGVPITKELISKCRTARAAYSSFLEAQKKEDREKLKEQDSLKQKRDELRARNEKRKRLEDEKKRLDEELDKEKHEIESLNKRLKKK